ncbi:uncharacterized protein DUF3301 [Thiogranum longum]|uniref:Uncharacterized protein DUF3301 n=1 Tax=Thiogranum longum TaxID=1537524 RepID=A0A4R1H671_9GAMM|nr:DUF3301 domain-containing protein [Thiogranum longum]TCK17237.1 uncharacterized protein DUF3301 [Thiogranum longum]
MSGSSGLLLLILLGLLIWLWQNSLRARESAIRAAREACQQQHFQLLDGSIVLQRLMPGRQENGRLSLRRTFLFSYSEDGLQRKTGFVIMSGNHIEQVGL